MQLLLPCNFKGWRSSRDGRGPEHCTTQPISCRRLDAERVYRDLTPYRALVDLVQDGWRVDYELTNRQAQGGGAHYVIDVRTGQIRSKRYEQ